MDQSTEQIILEAATRHFAEKGFEGARVEEVARAAGVNKATLYYQIGDKEALYHAVLERVFRHTAEAIEAALAGGDDVEEQMRHFVTVFARTTGADRYTAPLLMREIASGGAHLPETAVAQMGRIVNALTTTLTRGVQQGRFRPVNPFMIHMMIVGSLNLYAANEPIRRRNAARQPAIYEASHFISNEEAGEQIADLILAAIRHQQP